MRICLITPGHLSTNPRLVKEADALSEAGHEVTVIAATYQAWSQEADKVFAARPWRILPPTPFGPRAPRPRRLVQVARRQVARALVRSGVDAMALVRTAFHPAGPGLAAAARRTPADLYIAHYVPALPAAALAARRWGALYAFDAEDFHPGDHGPDPRYDEDRGLTAAIDRAYLPGCSYVTAASPGIADAYVEAYGIARPTVVLNVFPRAQAPDGSTPRGWATAGPSIYWFSQTIGPNRGLEAAVRALALAKSCPHLFLRGVPMPGFIESLTYLAARQGVAERLHILPPAPPEEMACLAAGYDLGLSAEPGHSLNNRLALGNKLFTYLLAGVPILASDGPAHRQFAPGVSGAIGLFAIDDAVSLAQAIDGFLSSAEGLQTARKTAFRLGRDRFNWDLEKQVMLGCVERALGGGAAGAP